MNAAQERGIRGRGRGRRRGRGGTPATPAIAGSDTWIAKDNSEWKKQPVRQAPGRQVAANVMHTTPGPTRYASRNVDGPLSAFQLFMRKNILLEIIRWTNKEGRITYGEEWIDVTEKEFNCYLGLLILSGVYKS